MSSPFEVEVDFSDPDGCFWCGKPCPKEQVCPLTGDVKYCSPDHLKNHYHIVQRPNESNLNNNNERICLPYKICYEPDRGRFAVATRDIQPTELVIADWPMVVGPSRQQKVVCVECLSPVDGKLRCPDCNFPMCSTDCLSSLNDTDDFGHTLKWHRNYECKLLKDVGFKAEDSLYKTRATASTEVPLLLVQIASLAPYRLLLKGLRAEEGSQDLVRPPLYNFCAPVQETMKICAFEEDVLQVIWSGFKMKDRLPEKKIVRQAIGQLFNNAKSLEKAGHDGTGLFGLYSILNHSCISNAKCSVGQSCQGYPLEVRAQVEIRAGDEITTRYVGVNIGLPQRSDMLREHWMFVCNCKRCADPTDCGTYSSAIRCLNCNVIGDVGFLIPNYDNNSSEWYCRECQCRVHKAFVEKVIDFGHNLISTAIGFHNFVRGSSGLNNPTKLQELIVRLNTIFHPNHYLIAQMKFVLLCVLRNSQDTDDSESVNQSIVNICLDLLTTMNVLDPGVSRNRGKILKDLIPSLMKLAKLKHSQGIISDVEFIDVKDDCSNYAKDLVQCFKHEFA